MKILIGIFFGLILSFLTSKIKMKVHYLDKAKNSLKIEFDVNFGIYLFGFIKILGISLKEDGIHFLFFRFPYNKLKIDKDSMKFLKDFSVLNVLKSLHLKLEKLHFNLDIGTENVMLTAFSVFIISTFFSIISAKSAKQINLKKYYYNITPIYNTNQLSFEISAQISLKTINLMKMLINAQHHKKDKKEYKIHVKKVAIKI